MEKLENKIIKEIELRNLKPRSKAFFKARIFAINFLSVLSIFITSVAMASLFYQVQQSNFKDVLEKTDFSVVYYVFITLPYLWFLIGLIFILLFAHNFRKVKRNYRYTFTSVVSGALLLSLFIGSIIHMSGLSKVTENLAEQNIEIYRQQKQIQTLKTDIFLNKLYEIGVTAEMVENDPELKKEIRRRYLEKVLGREYESDDLDECKVIKLTCSKDQKIFSDNTGCGCGKK
jgi:glucan phosphoethanolaminetransferase (alkaline phosphatase superfamily)